MYLKHCLPVPSENSSVPHHLSRAPFSDYYTQYTVPDVCYFNTLFVSVTSYMLAFLLTY